MTSKVEYKVNPEYLKASFVKKGDSIVPAKKGELSSAAHFKYKKEGKEYVRVYPYIEVIPIEE